MPNGTEQQLLSQIVATIKEFHTTSNAAKRTEIDTALKQLKKSNEGLNLSFALLDFNQPTVVQHYGACIMYDSIRERWDDCVSNGTLTNKMKEVLVEKLTLGAAFLNQSVVNKLTSALAMFALCCIPDIWSEPIRDFAIIWSDKPELLLRVLAELAVEFHRVQIPLNQRLSLKSSLHQKQQDVIKIINLVLCDKSTSPSLRNAAVECLEQWLNLPGLSLNEWQPALLPFLSTVNDKLAFARILNVLVSHSELPSLENFAMQLCTFISQSSCQSITQELHQIDQHIKSAAHENSEFDYMAELEDFGFLISALATFIESLLHTLLIASLKKQDAQVLRFFCDFFKRISTWSGVFPIDETISDGAEPFWNSLREELTSLDCARFDAGVRNQLLKEFGAHYIQLLWSAAKKLSYPPPNILQQFNKEQIEKFERYRSQRVEVAVNTYIIAPEETSALLTKLLSEACAERNILRVESVLFLLCHVADYMSEKDSVTIDSIIMHCSSLAVFWSSENVDDCWARLAKVLLQLLYAMSHLVSTGDEASKHEVVCIRMALMLLRSAEKHFAHGYQAIREIVEHALNAVEKYIGDGSGACGPDVIELTLSICYAHFEDDQYCERTRLIALRCVGYCLVMRTNSSNSILNDVHGLLEPRLRVLQQLLSVNDSSMNDVRELERRCLFELDSLAALLASQRNTRPSVDRCSNKVASSVLEHCLPLLLNMLHKFIEAPDPVTKICDVLRAALVAVDVPDATQQILNAYFEVLDFVMLKHSSAASQLAKSLTLIVAQNEDSWQSMVIHMDSWFKEICKLDECNEDYIELAYHIVKKHWRLIASSPQHLASILRSAREITLKVLGTCCESNLCRKSAMLLVTLVRNCVNNDVTPDVLAEAGNRIIVAIFVRLQHELVRSTAEALAEILMHFIRRYPAETRGCLNNLPYGNTQQVTKMLETHDLKAFRQLAMQFNMQRRKEMKI